MSVSLGKRVIFAALQTAKCAAYLWSFVDPHVPEKVEKL